MPAGKGSVSPIRPKPQDRKSKPTRKPRPDREAGVEDIIDFDAEVAAMNKAKKTKKFRLRGFDYTLGKGPNPYQLQQIDTTEDFDITQFLGSYIIPTQRARFLEAIRTADYDHNDFALLQQRIMEANADRPTAAS